MISKLERKLKKSMDIKIKRCYKRNNYLFYGQFAVYAVLALMVYTTFSGINPSFYYNSSKSINVIDQKVSIAKNSYISIPFIKSDNKEYTYYNFDNDTVTIISKYDNHEYQIVYSKDNMKVGVTDRVTFIHGQRVYMYKDNNKLMAQFEYMDYLITIKAVESVEHFNEEVVNIIKENLK